MIQNKYHQKVPEKARLLYENALSARENCQYDESIQSLKSILSLEIKHPYIYLLLGLNYMNTARLVIAIGYFNSYLKWEPYDPNVWKLKGFCVLKYTQYKNSIPYLKKAIGLGCHDRDIFVLLGEALFRSQKYLAARKCLLYAHSLKGSCDFKRLYDFLFRSINPHIEAKERKYDHREALVRSIKKETEVKTIICVGDSHVLNLEAVPDLIVHQTGSPTAFNLSNPNSSSQALPQILSLAKNYEPSSTLFVLTYGEIDIRNHIYKQLLVSSKDLIDICKSVVESLLRVANQLHQYGFKVMINGPFGSGNGVPRYGETQDRNYIAACINQLIEQSTESTEIFSSLLDIIVDSDYIANTSFFGEVDENHLDKTYSTSLLILSKMLVSTKNNWKTKKLKPELTLEKKQLAFTGFMYIEESSEKAQTIFSNESSICSASTSSYLFDTLFISLDGHYLLTDISIIISKIQEPSKELIISFYDANFRFLEKCCSNKVVNDKGYDYQINCPTTFPWYIKIEFGAVISLNAITSLKFQADYMTIRKN